MAVAKQVSVITLDFRGKYSSLATETAHFSHLISVAIEAGLAHDFNRQLMSFIHHVEKF